jgi:hypothetical protein
MIPLSSYDLPSYIEGASRKDFDLKETESEGIGDPEENEEIAVLPLNPDE